ncbi:MAG: hypothetical protein RM347_035380 [Nostoc sp. ChiQUE02]|nr:hypothetical protein [Nostoc sp. ChiQUE02]
MPVSGGLGLLERAIEKDRQVFPRRVALLEGRETVDKDSLRE